MFTDAFVRTQARCTGPLLLALLLAILLPVAWAQAPAPPAALPSALSASALAPTPLQTLEVFVREGCPHCAKAEVFLQALAHERPDLHIVIRDVSKEPAAMQRLQDLARQLNSGAARVPAFHVGGQMLFGYSEEAATDRLIRSVLQGQAVAAGAHAAAADLSCAAMEGSTCRSEEAADAYQVTMFGHTVTLDDVGLPAFTVAMGLLDGLNPCSMWVLILMISLLSTLNDRRRMLAIAGTFVLVEGIAYFVFMAAWLNLFLLIGLSRASQLLIAAVAIVAGLIHMKDFWAPGMGVSLSIPDKQKPGIYARMRAILHARSLPAAIVGVVVLALLVQVVEFLCTSGFPALFTRILTLRGLDTASYYGYLLLYNAAYMLDDVIVLTIGVVTLSHRRLQEKEGRWLKLISGLVMVGLGLYLVFD
ncbi:MAG: glutaredoxin domain-containing protein [Rubrivivax sp.]|nr:glutaredoxin domain-containing protein [Rubrivivax sp.]